MHKAERAQLNKLVAERPVCLDGFLVKNARNIRFDNVKISNIKRNELLRFMSKVLYVTLFFVQLIEFLISDES